MALNVKVRWCGEGPADGLRVSTRLRTNAHAHARARLAQAVVRAHYASWQSVRRFNGASCTNRRW